MREILFRGKRTSTKEWVEGDLQQDRDLEQFYIYGYDYYTDGGELEREEFCYEVLPDTVGQYTGLGDVWEHDIVEIWGKRFEVVKECGAFGIVSSNAINYELFEKKIKEYTGCDNNPCFCYNDNFISLWELYWNYNEEERNLFCVNIIGNVYDNPKLLEEGAE